MYILEKKLSSKSQNPDTDKTWSAQPYSDNLEMVIPADGVELVLFAGKNMFDAVQRF